MPTIGKAVKCATSTLKTVTRPPPVKHVFISRLDPSTNEDDIKEHLKTLNTNYNNIFRIKARQSHYSSFYVSCNTTSYNNILNPEHWPQGTLLMPYLSKTLTTFKGDKIETKTGKIIPSSNTESELPNTNTQ